MSGTVKARIGIIGGTGLGAALAGEEAIAKGQVHDLYTPFGSPSGLVVTTEVEGVPVAFLARHGAGHMLNPSVVPYRANIWAMKMLGVKYIIASGACGSLQEQVRPRDLVVADQVIDKTFKRENSFFDGHLAVHVDFAYPFCEKLRRVLLESASAAETTVHEKGTYVCMEGPAFSTRAESLLHKSWGADLIGMTVMPEAKLAREAEMCYALVALATDYDCWKVHDGDVDQHELMKVILGHLQAATGNAVKLIREAVKRAGSLLEADCEHHGALEMAIFSDRSQVTDPTYEKLKLLIERYV